MQLTMESTRVWTLTVFLCLVGLETALADNGARGDTLTPEVTSGSGTFQGSFLTSRRGRPIYSFRGIRYAEPPVGELRFQPARLKTSYEGKVDASGDGPLCPQPMDPGLEQLADEDCLTVNVYSPTLPTLPTMLTNWSQSRQLPVLVFMHPGGFYAFSGRGGAWGPEYLLDHEIVLVTINYRLGSLGFIATGDKHAPGNLGFKDQVTAFKWIQRNIAAFGGNPGDITISGYSAGAFSVGLHMISPMSRGLFHKAIMMSASPISQWRQMHHQRDLAEKQAAILSCPTSSSKQIIDCLKTKTAKELGDSLFQFFEFSYNPVLLWRQVTEPDCGQERFLVEDPVESIRNGRIHDVPLLIGMTQIEFSGSGFTVAYNDTLREAMERDWARTAAISFLLERNSSRSLLQAATLRDAYLHGRPLAKDDASGYRLGLLFGDALISFATHRFANLMAESLRSPIYYYRFNYTGEQSFFYHPVTGKSIGAVHHDDLIYLFNISYRFEPITLESPHSLFVDQLTTLWTNFVISGNPNRQRGQDILNNVSWPAMTTRRRRYLQINNDGFHANSNMAEDRFAVWEQLFPLMK